MDIRDATFEARTYRYSLTAWIVALVVIGAVIVRAVTR